jgi:hypothetical protein
VAGVGDFFIIFLHVVVTKLLLKEVGEIIALKLAENNEKEPRTYSFNIKFNRTPPANSGTGPAATCCGAA